VSTGAETETATTIDNFNAETDGFTLEANAEFRTIYYEYSESDYYDDYTVIRAVDVNDEWVATSGYAETNEYEKYQNDVMVVTANYERDFELGTITGELGWIENKLEEFDYDSASTIVSGDWILQSGDGFFVQEISYGDFANGSNNNNSESWTNLNGTIERVDYVVENNEWTIDDETVTSIDSLEYLYNNSVATIPAGYAAIIVDTQTYDDFEDYFASNTTGNNNNNTEETTAEEKNLAILIEMELKRELHAKMDISSYYIVNRRTVQTTYEVNVSINGNIATVIIGSTTETTIGYFLPPSMSYSTTGLQEIGRFEMELGANGKPNKNVIELAKYLINLMNEFSQDILIGKITLTTEMTRHNVRAEFIAKLEHNHADDTRCKASYALEESVGSWAELQGRIAALTSTHSIISKIKDIAMNTVNSSYSWSNTQPQTGDIDILGISSGAAKGNCAKWVSNVWNKIKKLPGAYNRAGEELIYFLFDDGTAIAIQPEILDYNGNIPTFSSHVVLRVEVGYAHKDTGEGITGDGLIAVTYLDNNLYGGINRIFNIVNVKKSLLPYNKDGFKCKTLLDSTLLTPTMWRYWQTQFINWG
jgi:hypothetical protein